MNNLIAIVLFLGVHIGNAADVKWNHEGRDYWPKQFPACNGKRQSPINIDVDDAKVESTVQDLKFARYNQDWDGKMVNTGHALQFNPDMPPGMGSVPGIKFGAIETGTYNLLQAHFHWGSHSGQGSEHRINDIEYPMEMHLVHIRNAFDDNTTQALDVEECTQNDRICGLAVVGILFHVGSENNTVMEPIVEAALHIAEDADQFSHAHNVSINFIDFINEGDTEANGPAYYYYKGSLTTPGCQEVVSWVVLENTISISEYQLEAFRKLKYLDGAPMVDNYRHPQPVNNRMIKRVLRELKEESPV